jgi:hypothetical protein
MNITSASTALASNLDPTLTLNTLTLTPKQYTILAYAVGVGLLAAYALILWMGHRVASRRNRVRGM